MGGEGGTHRDEHRDAGPAPGAVRAEDGEEEVRREIRALKGLVLNRRSFMPRASRPDLPSLPVGVAVGGASSG